MAAIESKDAADAEKALEKKMNEEKEAKKEAEASAETPVTELQN